MWRRLVTGSSLLAFTACTGMSGGSIGGSAGAAAVGTARAVISASEIVAAKVVDAYGAVAQLRPEFLRGDGGTRAGFGSGARVRVYLDNIQIGGVEALKNLPVENVTQIRYIGGQEAAIRWGPDHRGGVIQVSTQRRPPD